MEGYWCYWHGGKGYSGVGLHVSKTIAPERPAFSHPEFDYENRIVDRRSDDVGDLTVASVYVPNGGKDFPAKMQFLEAMDAYAASFQARRPAARALRRHERRPDRPRRASEGAQAARDRPAPRGARAPRADHRPRAGRRRPRARSRQRRPVHLVGAVAEHAAAQHRLAARLRARERSRSQRRPPRARCRKTSARATTRRCGDVS